MRADGRTSEAAVQAHADALETSRKDARVLLWFATREGRKLDKKVLEDVVDAESKLSNTPTSEDEVKFWTAYRDLAAAVQPRRSNLFCQLASTLSISKAAPASGLIGKADPASGS